MNQYTRSVLWKFIGASIVIMAFYNIFGSYLEEVKIVAVNAWFIAPFVLILFSIAVMPFINEELIDE